MTLGQLRASLEALVIGASGADTTTAVPVTDIAYDSRRVRPGAVFVAMKGLAADGVSFAADAVSRGACAVVAEVPRPEGVRAPWLEVSDARLALALAGAAFHGHPSRRFPVVGITGTNGKTTTAYLLASIFDAAGMRCGMLGTVAYRVGTGEREAARTTPEGPDVQALLAEMYADGSRACVMEVSSHALALRRVDGMHFAAGVFTNLTRDHLDFHGSMDAYFAAKRRLFEMLPSGAPGIINADDPRAPSLTAVCRRPVTYGLRDTADVRPSSPLTFSLAGLQFDAETPQGRVTVRSRLVGRANASNVLAAVATAAALDVPLSAVAAGLEALSGVPGRFEVASEPGDDVTVVVDYAHTDDALRQLLETARPMAQGRLVTVFGCGGDRDRTKRPLMGMVAARLSDVVILTSDNPRTEDPARILEDVRRGMAPGGHDQRAAEVTSLVDRAEAIARAVERARTGDLILVAGKGHEKTQDIGGRVLPFDDVDVAQQALARRRLARGR